MVLKKYIFIPLLLGTYYCTLQRINAHDNDALLLSCQNSHGKKLLKRIFSLSVAEQRNVFAYLSADKRKDYLSNLTPASYAKFLDAYSENQWKELFEHLTPTEKNYWPKSVKQQRNSIKTIENDAENVRNIALAAQLVADSLFPPAVLVHAVEFCYIAAYNIHPIIEEQINKNFKIYLEEQFHIKRN